MVVASINHINLITHEVCVSHKCLGMCGDVLCAMATLSLDFLVCQSLLLTQFSFSEIDSTLSGDTS